MRYAGSLPPPPLLLAVPGFSGAIEELLTLVRSGVFSTASLPLAEIASAVLAWVCELEGRWKIDSAEVVEVTAALIRMKSRGLLPAAPLESPAASAGSVESADLLEDLDVLRSAIQHLRELWKPVHASTLESFLSAADSPEVEEPLQDTVLDLIRALEYGLNLTRDAPPPIHYIREPYTLEELSQLILARCAEANAQDRDYILNELLSSQAAAAPGLFLAALELVRNKQVILQQVDSFGDIQLRGASSA